MHTNDPEKPDEAGHERRLTKLENTVDALIERQGSFMDRYNARQAGIAREPELLRAMRALEDMAATPPKLLSKPSRRNLRRP